MTAPMTIHEVLDQALALRDEMLELRYSYTNWLKLLEELPDV